jgi:hypothetical protein
MLPPAELAGVADIWSASSKKQQLPSRVGNWEISKPDCLTQTNITESSGEGGWQERKDSCSFEMKNQTSEWKIACERVVRQVFVQSPDGRELTKELENKLLCKLEEFSKGQWELSLSGGGREGWSGKLLKKEGNNYLLKPTWLQSRHGGDEIAGVVLYENEQPRAALDFIRSGVFWVDPGLSSPAAALGACLAVALYTFRDQE